MAKLHELLAAEKTPNGAWNQLYEETVKKFNTASTYFEGHSKSLSMIEDTPQNKSIELQNREEKPVTTTVYDTLEYALGIYARAEDLQYQKNATNRTATGTVMWRGSELLKDMPVDELLGLEARLQKIRKLYEAIPTLDASRHWLEAGGMGPRIFEVAFPEVTTKTEKQTLPVIMKDATKEHPAQVAAVTKDVVVGAFHNTRRSGAATTVQKSEALKVVDELLIEIKQARMRANQTEAVSGSIARALVEILLDPLKF